MLIILYFTFNVIYACNCLKSKDAYLSLHFLIRAIKCFIRIFKKSESIWMPLTNIDVAADTD